MLKFQGLMIYDKLKNVNACEKMLQAYTDYFCEKLQKGTWRSSGTIVGTQELIDDLEIYLALESLVTDGNRDRWEDEVEDDDHE